MANGHLHTNCAKEWQNTLRDIEEKKYFSPNENAISHKLFLLFVFLVFYIEVLFFKIGEFSLTVSWRSAGDYKRHQIRNIVSIPYIFFWHYKHTGISGKSQAEKLAER